MASNSEGVWNSSGAAVPFEIVPRFWQAWWFQYAVVSVCVLAALGIYRLRLHQLTASLNLRFEEQARRAYAHRAGTA